MQTSRPSTTPQRQDAEVVRWRRGRLIDAGFGPDLAAALAGDPRFDLHGLLQLVERGCAPALAARILAPADDEGAWR